MGVLSCKYSENKNSLSTGPPYLAKNTWIKGIHLFSPAVAYAVYYHKLLVSDHVDVLLYNYGISALQMLLLSYLSKLQVLVENGNYSLFRYPVDENSSFRLFAKNKYFCRSVKAQLVRSGLRYILYTSCLKFSFLHQRFILM